MAPDQASIDRLLSAFDGIVDDMEVNHQARLDEVYQMARQSAAESCDYLLLCVELAGNDVEALNRISTLIDTHTAQRMPVAGHA